MSLMRPGDYVIIQFGHNDEKIKSLDRYTVPGGTFDENLRRFVNDAKKQGGDSNTYECDSPPQLPADSNA